MFFGRRTRVGMADERSLAKYKKYGENQRYIFLQYFYDFQGYIYIYRSI